MSRFGPKDSRSAAAKVKKSRMGILSPAEQLALMETVTESLNKDFGEGTANTLENAPVSIGFPFQISTGSLGLDIAIGPILRDLEGVWHRGMPGGRMMEIFGPESSGKTTLLLHMIAYLQRKLSHLGLLAGLIDVEHAIDPDYAEHGIGIDPKMLQFSQPSSGDEAIEIADRWLRTNQFGIIGIDSVASLLTTDELEGNVTDTTVGGQARLMSKACKQFSNYLGGSSGCPTLIVFINQLREKIGVMFGSPETTPGGRALRYYSHVRLDVRRGANIPGNSEDPSPIGQKMKVTCIKNKVGSPYRSAEFDLYWGKGIDRDAELAELCEKHGVIKRSGAWYKHEGLELSANGIANMVNAIRADRKKLGIPLYNELMTAVMAGRGMTPEGEQMEGFILPPPNIAADFVPEDTDAEDKAVLDGIEAAEVKAPAPKAKGGKKKAEKPATTPTPAAPPAAPASTPAPAPELSEVPA